MASMVALVAVRAASASACRTFSTIRAEARGRGADRIALAHAEQIGVGRESRFNKVGLEVLNGPVGSFWSLVEP